MKFNIKNIVCCLMLICFCSNSYSQENISLDSIISNIKEDKYPQIVKKQKLDEALELTYKVSNDTLRNEYILSLSNLYRKNSDSLMFRKTTSQSLDLSEKLNDSISIARSYWRLGSFLKTIKSDSSYHYYHKAKEIYELKSEQLLTGQMLFNMAVLQKNVKDYIGSQVTTTNAIEVFNALDDYDGLYRCYNNLGIIFNNLEDHENAIGYYNDALETLKRIPKKKILEATVLNNIGIVYREKENHVKAIDYYNKALAFDSLQIKNPKLYATLTDNIAYSKFKMNDFSELPDLFYKALKIREDLDISAGIVINKLHLSEYYLSQKDTIKSFNYANKAKELAKEIKSYDHLLDLYKLLAVITTNDKNSIYLKKYIKLSDSLIKNERTTRNKFALIKYETDVVKSENKKLNLKINWIVAISSAVIFFGFLIYVITQQRTRNKELEMEQQQQRANEEIYNLMIDQQDKIEEGRKREKERISLELHDGILGRLFGTRLSLGSLNAKDDSNSKKTREQYINELQSIEEEVRNISHELGLDNFDTTTSYSTMIANLLEEQSKITNFKYQIEDDDRIVWTDIPGHIKINIYRIIQESVQNINKYAKAKNVILDFKKNNNHIILTIKDDGIGFNQEKRSSGIGLKNMKSRVTLLHGQFTINSVPGKGTSISVDVPMT
ncbi:tetratricopeptide repeat-containing sensor histidine kinase [Kordia sp.]|uniref:tetratricopeptide repeat-containing sensor histidine kinase n=1 Tax=Kordia sp. TaxID=1965332 RepID=UPI003D2DA6EB